MAIRIPMSWAVFPKPSATRRPIGRAAASPSRSDGVRPATTSAVTMRTRNGWSRAHNTPARTSSIATVRMASGGKQRFPEGRPEDYTA